MRPLLSLEQQLCNTLEWLAHYGANRDGGVTRLLYSPAWLKAQHALFERMKDGGLSPYYDEAGNLFGRLEGTNWPEQVVLTGSHLDTVRNGGLYDGALGIAAGLTALHRLHEQFGRPKRTLEVVSFCEEEGSRFPVTFWGSGNITGRWSMSRIPDVVDDEGISLSEAMAAAGFGPGTHRSCKRNDLYAYIELHIEQGMELEHLGVPVGIVQGIVGQVRLTFEVCGETNHAGTTRMGWRRDALAGTAEMTLALEREAIAEGDPFVATVGKLEAAPNISNVIAGSVLFTVDLRHPEAAKLDALSRRIVELFYGIAAARSLQLSHRQWMHAESVPMAPHLLAELERICLNKQIRCHQMHSGAGHDAQIVSTACPAAMLFVPSRAGVSHSPLEHTDPADMAAGAEVLMELLYKLAYEP